MIALTDVEAELTLFAEGISGNYYHIKPVSEFSSRYLTLPEETAAATSPCGRRRPSPR